MTVHKDGANRTPKRIEQDRLPRPASPVKPAQPAREIEIARVDEGDVADGQAGEQWGG